MPKYFNLQQSWLYNYNVFFNYIIYYIIGMKSVLNKGIAHNFKLLKTKIKF